MIEYRNLARAFVKPGEFAPVCVPSYYRALYPDLADMSDSQLKNHYRRHGWYEGRSASPCDLRSAFLSCLAPGLKILEIGPFTAPSLRGPNIKYFDVLDADGLRERARAHGYPIIEPVRIDYISPTGTLADVPAGFDAIYSSHALEHTPNFIGHLLEASRLLRAGGTYCLTLPDMRFTFDHYRTPTKAEDVITAHRENRRVHPRAAVLSYYTESTHNDPALHWRGEHGPSPRPDIEERAALAERELNNSDGGYVDIHAWFFTPDTFRTLIQSLTAAREIPLTIDHVYNTPQGNNEFNVVLRKT